jgi:hypothetical protein
MRSSGFVKFGVFAIALLITITFISMVDNGSRAQTNVKAEPTPTPAFDQAAAVARIREQIKGREQEPAEKVFKNIQYLNGIPAGRIPMMMQMGYSRSLGVDCTHCHVPDKWEADEKPQKQVAREMAAMVNSINTEKLRSIKNLRSENPAVNCTTCHRGQLKPALNLGTN